jgi:hypothetical protein
VSVWESIASGDYLLVGGNSPLMINYSLLEMRMQQLPVAKDLVRVNINGPMDILGRFIMDRDAVLRAAGPGPIHTDDRRQLEFILPRVTFTPQPQRVPGIVNQILAQHVNVVGYVLFPNTPKDQQLRQKLIELDRNRQFDPLTTERKE